MRRKKEQDEEIIEGIRAGGRKQEKSIRLLYETYFHLTFSARQKYPQLREDELISAYNSAILAIRKQVVEGRFRGDSSLWTFLNTIFFRACVDILRKLPTNLIENAPELPEQESGNPNALQQVMEKEDFEHLISTLNQLGDPCRQIILDSEYHGYASEEIAQRIGFSNAKSVNSKKYNCLKRLRKMIHRQPN
jgi:RNA polymerase sigma factor (sigma-70 family)